MSGLPESIFLSSQDVTDLTGSSRAAIQVRWLRSNAIPFILGGDGQPKIAIQTLMKKLDPAEPVEDAPAEPMPTLVELVDNWDKVSEALMAELIGATPKALQRRRDRSAIPTEVWREIGGRIMYSLRRYEAWLDGHWPPFEEPAHPQPIKGRNLRKKKTVPGALKAQRII